MQNEPIEVTIKVTHVLESLGISYLIGGLLASTLYGMVPTSPKIQTPYFRGGVFGFAITRWKRRPDCGRFYAPCLLPRKSSNNLTNVSGCS